MKEAKIQEENGQIAIYHCVKKYENFNKAAEDIYNLVRKAQDEYPNQKRCLYLDIDGHRESDGTFDNDMFELLAHFLVEVIIPCITEIHQPFGIVKNEKQKDLEKPYLKILSNKGE